MHLEEAVVTSHPADVVDAERVESAIEGKQIGERIRRLRTKRSMGLVELGKKTGLSASFLSQLETGRVVPTVRNLARISLAFGKDLAYFFREEHPLTFRILRKSERVRLQRKTAEGSEFLSESMRSIVSDGSMVPCVAEFVGGKDDVSFHPKIFQGTEFAMVTDGTVELASENESRVMEKGDVAWLDGTRNRTYTCKPGITAKVILITQHTKGN